MKDFVAAWNKVMNADRYDLRDTRRLRLTIRGCLAGRHVCAAPLCFRGSKLAEGEFAMAGSLMVLAAVCSFLGTHFALSHPLRRPLVGPLGRMRFWRSTRWLPSPPSASPSGRIRRRQSPRRFGLLVTGSGVFRPWQCCSHRSCYSDRLSATGRAGRRRQCRHGVGARCLRGDPAPHDVGVRDLGRMPHPGLSHRQEHHPVGRNHRARHCSGRRCRTARRQRSTRPAGRRGKAARAICRWWRSCRGAPGSAVSAAMRWAAALSCGWPRPGRISRLQVGRRGFGAG